jgi:putative transposase
VAIEAIKEQSSLSELSSRYEIEVSQISKWKKEFLEKSSIVFDLATPQKTTEKETKKLYEQIGRLNMQVEFLKKVVEKYSIKTRQNMVEEGELKLSIVHQCRLLRISHSGYYYVPATESTKNLQIMQTIDKIHLDYPFYGFRRIQVALREYGSKLAKN